MLFNIGKISRIIEGVVNFSFQFKSPREIESNKSNHQRTDEVLDTTTALTE